MTVYLYFFPSYWVCKLHLLRAVLYSNPWRVWLYNSSALSSVACLTLHQFYTLDRGPYGSTSVLYSRPWPVWLYISFILPSVACLALQPFFTLAHKLHDFRGKTLLNIKCLFWFTVKILYETLHILRWLRRDIITNIHRSPYKVTVILVRF